MQVDLVVASTERDGRLYLTWTPVQATARLIGGPGPGRSVDVEFRSSGTVGHVLFDMVRGHAGTRTLTLALPGDGSPMRFWVAGDFGHPSQSFGDAVIEVVDPTTSAKLEEVPLMVRIRRDAQRLSTIERDRFLAAFGALNGQGTGRFAQFRDMHTAVSRPQAHGNRGFLPWHRAYTLDFERELQAIDPEVTLPYWRFDQAAANVFSLDFMGLPDPATGTVQFVPGHPLQSWVTEGVAGISRAMTFAPGSHPSLRTEAQCLAFGNGVFDRFWSIVVGPGGIIPAQSGIEVGPHGDAHDHFFPSWLSSVPTAARDPMFFLLHANVDRLWAKWQWFYKRALDSDLDAFPQNASEPPGHNIADTMWPWNNVTSPTDPSRPPTAPGGAMALSVVTSAPGPSPTVRSMLDYQGVHGGAHLGFDYDDVPFEFVAPVVA